MQYTRFRRSSFYSGYFPPGVKWLLISNIAIFVLDNLAEVFLHTDLFRLMGLVPAMVLQLGFVWQPFTYMFLHSGIWHILFNMLVLWMFGLDLERDWGTKRFLQYYFLCGIGAALCVIAAALVRPSEMLARTIGASGAIYGLLLAYGVVYADRVILMSLLFPIKAKYAVMIFGAIAFIGSWRPGSGVSHIAHLGGMIFGYIFLKLRLNMRGFAPVAALRGQVNDWKVKRARRKFQVYLRKRDDRDRWVN
ncbi:MAG: rhomboid family intramembrane serine protease [Acidobacteriota bacterium]